MTMVERVAEAISLSFREEGYVEGVSNPAEWNEFLKAARAAIAAMREPNRAMRVAAGEALYLPIEEARRLAEEEKFDVFANDGVIAWLAMIDAALSERGE